MHSLIGVNDDYGDDVLGRGAVLPTIPWPVLSGALAQDAVWPASIDLLGPRLTLQRRGNRLKVIPMGIERSILDVLMPVIERMAELVALPRGWDSRNASPVSDTALRRTIEFLLEHVADGIDCPVVVPTVHGGLQLEWHNNGVDVEVEVAPDGHVSCLAEDGSSEEPVELGLAGNEEWIRRWLKRASG